MDARAPAFGNIMGGGVLALEGPTFPNLEAPEPYGADSNAPGICGSPDESGRHLEPSCLSLGTCHQDLGD